MTKINVLKLLKEQGFRYVFFHPNRKIIISQVKPELNKEQNFFSGMLGMWFMCCTNQAISECQYKGKSLSMFQWL